MSLDDDVQDQIRREKDRAELERKRAIEDGADMGSVFNRKSQRQRQIHQQRVATGKNSLREALDGMKPILPRWPGSDPSEIRCLTCDNTGYPLRDGCIAWPHLVRTDRLREAGLTLQDLQSMVTKGAKVPPGYTFRIPEAISFSALSCRQTSLLPECYCQCDAGVWRQRWDSSGQPDADEPVDTTSIYAQLSRTEEEQNDRLRAAGFLSAKERSQTLETFDFNLLWTASKANATAYTNDVGRRVDAIDRTFPGFYLWGAPGTGKSHLARAVARRVLDGGFFARFIVSRSILQAFGAIATRRELADAIMLQFTTPTLLVIDDLGSEYGTAWAVNTLFEVIDQRDQAGKATGFTSNWALDHINNQARDDQARLQWDRITSRIRGSCVVIEMASGDYRAAHSPTL